MASDASCGSMPSHRSSPGMGSPGMGSQDPAFSELSDLEIDNSIDVGPELPNVPRIAQVAMEELEKLPAVLGVNQASNILKITKHVKKSDRHMRRLEDRFNTAIDELKASMDTVIQKIDAQSQNMESFQNTMLEKFNTFTATQYNETSKTHNSALMMEGQLLHSLRITHADDVALINRVIPSAPRKIVDINSLDLDACKTILGYLGLNDFDQYYPDFTGVGMSVQRETEERTKALQGVVKREYRVLLH